MAEYVDMPSTMWTSIARAKEGDVVELDRLLRRYRPPVLAFVRNSIRDRDEAEDVTQEIFIALVKEGVLLRVDPEKGKFRHLLLAVARHLLSMKRRSESAARRGGGRKPLSLDAPATLASEDPLAARIAAPEDPDMGGFDTLWVENLVRLAMGRLRDQSRCEGTKHFDALYHHVNDGLGYADIARKLGIEVTDVKNCVYQARLRLRRFVLQEIQDYSATRAEYDAEVAYLMKLLE